MCTAAELAAFKRRLAKVDPILAESDPRRRQIHAHHQRAAHAVSCAGARHRASAAERHRGGKHLRPIRRAVFQSMERRQRCSKRNWCSRRRTKRCARSACRSPRSRASRISRAKTLDGVVPPSEILHTLADDEIIERLTQVRGIGRWTVEMMLMSRLGRPDVLPIDDFGVRNGFRLAYGLRGMPTPRALAEFGARWAPLPFGGRVVPVARGGPAPRGQTTRARARRRASRSSRRRKSAKKVPRRKRSAQVKKARAAPEVVSRPVRLPTPRGSEAASTLPVL